MKRILEFSVFVFISAALLLTFPMVASAERLDTHQGMMTAYSPLVQAYKDRACTVSANHYLCPGDWFEGVNGDYNSTVNVHYPITVPVANDKTHVIFTDYWFKGPGSNGFAANADGSTGSFKYSIDPNKWYNCRDPNNQKRIVMPCAIDYVDEHNDGHNYNMSQTFVSNNKGFTVSSEDNNRHRRLRCGKTLVMYASNIPADGNCVNNPTDYIDANWSWYRANVPWTVDNLHQGLNTVYFAGTDASANYTLGSTPFHYDSIPPIISSSIDQSTGATSISADDDKSPGFDNAGNPNYSGLAYYIYRVSKDGGTTWGAWSGKLTEPTTLKLDGAANCKLDIIAYDNAGNKSENSGSSNGVSIDDKLIQGLYRVNTDVITAVSVINNSAEDILGCPVTFTVGGVTSQTTSIGIPAGSSNLVWFKWHTPSVPGNVTISATAGAGASASVDCYDNYIYPCDEKTPPNPLSTDRAPNGFTFMSPTGTDGSSSTSWGQWTYTIKTEVVTDKDGKPVKDKDGKDTIKNTTIWNYMSYSASLSAKLTVSPDGHCPTANNSSGQWNMKSGYGINERVVTTVSTTSPGDVTPVQRVAGFYPEFGYGSYDRLFDRLSGGIFELAKNKYSMYQSRVHFLPVWWPDRSDYTPQVYAFDAWTPGGPLSTYSTDSVKIQGSVFDDWHSGPIWSTR